MQRNELAALKWLKEAETHLTDTCFDPYRAAICSDIAILLYQQNPDTYPVFPVAKAFHFRAYANSLATTTITLAIILDFYEALKYADGDEKVFINRHFREALAPQEKNLIFSVIKTAPNTALEQALLNECIRKKSPLGAKMWSARTLKPCCLEKGTLKEICDRLKELNKQNISTNDKPTETINLNLFLQLALNDIKANKPEAALFRAHGALDIYHAAKEKHTHFSPTLSHLIRGYAHYENENLTQGILDITFALETATNQDHLAFQTLFNNHLPNFKQKSISSMRKLFEALLERSFKYTIFTAIQKIAYPIITRKLLEQCLDPTTALGARMWHQDDSDPCTIETGILKTINQHLQLIKTSLIANPNTLFAQQEKTSAAVRLTPQSFESQP